MAKVFAGELAYDLSYLAVLDPKNEGAQVTITLEHGGLMEKISFSNPGKRYANIRANGKLTISGDQVVWQLPKEKANLTYFIKLKHEKGAGKYDAYIDKNWAIFRGDDLIPPIHTLEADGAYAKATLEFELPEGWDAVETGWERESARRFLIDNRDRRFDRPTGWIIAGNIGTRNANVRKTSVVVAGPVGEHFRKMDVLTFLNFTWREVKDAFDKTPEKLLVVGAGDPMWRGGLSASNSLFLHADRPLVSENGTSPLLHELTHMVTRIRGVATASANDDWIAEGLAEFYSFELLYRAKGITKARRAKIIKGLDAWGKDVKNLRHSASTGPITARAVVLFDAVDHELRERSKNKYSLDDVVKKLMIKRKVSLDDLRVACEQLVGKDIKALNTPLLK